MGKHSRIPITANHLGKLMYDKELTQGDVAVDVGVHREYINRIKNDGVIPSVPLALRIAQVLGVRVEDIWEI